MSNNDGEDTIMNVRIPSSLSSQLEETYQRRGFQSKSEFVRTALRDAIHPSQELSEDALEDIKKSEEQVEEGDTTSLSDFTSETEDTSQSKHTDISLSNTDKKSKLSDLEELFSGPPDESEIDLDALVIGCGGAGNHITDRISKIRTGSVRTVAIDTDRNHLEQVEADTKLLIGKTIHDGYGTAGELDIGEESARRAEESIKEMISGVDLVFIVAGLGGGTGTGASPVIADFASEMGALVLGTVNTPFNVERSRRQKAKDGLKTLRSACDTVLAFDNNLLLDYRPDLPLGDAFAIMDNIIAESIENLLGTLSGDALVNIDFADFTTIVRDSGIGGALVGEGSLEDSNNIVEQTLQHPLFTGDISTASRGLIQITGPTNMTIADAEEIVELISHQMSGDTMLIWGAETSKNMDNKVRVTVFATGIEYTLEEVTKQNPQSKSIEGIEFLSNDRSSDDEQSALI